jgi:hypothetical protein
MKPLPNISRTLLYLVYTLLPFVVLHGCQEETGGPGRVSFLESGITLNTDQLEPVTFDLSIDPPASDASEVYVNVGSSGGLPGIAFRTIPPVSDGMIIVPVSPGDKIVSFEVHPDEQGIGYNTLFIDFEIVGSGTGLVSDGLAGVFSSLTILNVKDPVRPLPYSEHFDACDMDTGDGSLPAGWREQVIKQNSLGTGRWICAPSRSGLQCNAFAENGFNGDNCEVWLLSPPVSLTGATNPFMTFRSDRRFTNEGSLEFNVMISTDYTGDNFSNAGWTVFDPAVVAIEANDPGVDDYEQTDPLDLTSYTGDTITVAWVYYAEGSKFTSSILRIDDIRIASQGP